jgi:hypothetical protein
MRFGIVLEVCNQMVLVILEVCNHYIPLKQYQNDFITYLSNNTKTFVLPTSKTIPKRFYYIPLKQYQNDFINQIVLVLF